MANQEEDTVTVEGMKIIDPMSYRITIGDKCRDICDYQKANLQKEWPHMLEWGTVLLKIRSNHNRRMEAIQVKVSRNRPRWPKGFRVGKGPGFS
jgi:hypothetical protein